MQVYLSTMEREKKKKIYQYILNCDFVMRIASNKEREREKLKNAFSQIDVNVVGEMREFTPLNLLSKSNYVQKQCPFGILKDHNGKLYTAISFSL